MTFPKNLFYMLCVWSFLLNCLHWDNFLKLKMCSIVLIFHSETDLFVDVVYFGHSLIITLVYFLRCLVIFCLLRYFSPISLLIRQVVSPLYFWITYNFLSVSLCFLFNYHSIVKCGRLTIFQSVIVYNYS